MVTRAREARPRGELAEQGAVRPAPAAGATRSPIFAMAMAGAIGGAWRSLPPLS